MINQQTVISCPVYTHHWYQWHPYVGTWIAVLAFLGVIVPWLFRDPKEIGKREKVFWTFLMLALLGLEMWSLRRDGIEHDEERADAECKQLQQFNQIAATLGTAITTSQQQFQATMEKFSSDEKSQQTQFNATMRAFSNNESANQTRFGRLFNHEEELAQAESGVLEPGNDPTPPNSCQPPIDHPIPPDAVLIFLDDGKNTDLQVTVIRQFPQILLASQSHGPIITLKKTANGVAIIFDLRSSDGKIIARLDERGFVINRNNSLAIKKDNNSLDVVDLYGVDVLNINYLNPHAILVGGSIFSQIHPGVHIGCMDGINNTNIFGIP